MATSIPKSCRRNVRCPLRRQHAGDDPHRNATIIVLHFGDVLQRFSAAALIKPEDVDRGIRDCLHVGKQCNGYAISVKKLDSNRVGNFWLDSFNFKRETVITGWGVDALLVFVDDQLVHQLIGGQPTSTSTRSFAIR